MAVDYDRAFAKVILRRWNEISDKQRNARGISNRRGQLAPGDRDSYALHDTFKYQRGHADVFCEVYKKTPHVPPKEGERLLVVDIGAGAATVGVALGEALKRKKRERIDYLAFEPNPAMRKLGKQVLKHLGAGFNSAEYVTSLEDVDFTDIDRLLFTFSYVVHQNSVTRVHALQWASLIRRAVVEMDRAVELIYTTTAKRPGGAHLHLRRLLKQAEILKKPHPIHVQVQQRFPDPDSSDGQICWDEKNRLWKVRAEHWILST